LLGDPKPSPKRFRTPSAGRQSDGSASHLESAVVRADSVLPKLCSFKQAVS